MSHDHSYARFCAAFQRTEPPLVRSMSSKWKVLSQEWWDSQTSANRRELVEWAEGIAAFAEGHTEGWGRTCFWHPPQCVQDATLKVRLRYSQAESDTVLILSASARLGQYLGRLTAQEEQEEKKKDAVYDVFEAISKAAETKVR